MYWTEKDLIIKSHQMGETVESKEIKILNRIIRYTERGFEMEADLRHAELIIKQLGLEKNQPTSLAARMAAPIGPASRIPS